MWFSHASWLPIVAPIDPGEDQKTSGRHSFIRLSSLEGPLIPLWTASRWSPVEHLLFMEMSWLAFLMAAKELLFVTVFNPFNIDFDYQKKGP